MKVVTQNISNVDPKEMPRYAGMNFDRITQVINGGIEFGPNIQSSFAFVNFQYANTVVAVPHTLGRVPAGYIVIKQNAAGNVLTMEELYPWSNSAIYLSASAVMQATLIIL